MQKKHKTVLDLKLERVIGTLVSNCLRYLPTILLIRSIIVNLTPVNSLE